MAPRNKKQTGAAAKQPTKGRQNRAVPAINDDEPNSAASDTDDSPAEEQDDMGNALRELQLAMGRKEKKDTFLRDFEKSVQNDQTRLLGLLADTRKEREGEAGAFDSLFASLIMAAISPSGFKNKKSTASQENDRSLGQPPGLRYSIEAANHSLYASYVSLLEGCETIESAYLEFRKSATSRELEAHIPPNLQDIWTRDVEDMYRVIAAGMQASQAEIDQLLAIRRGHTAAVDSKESRKRNREFEKDEHLQMMLRVGAEQTGRDTKRKPVRMGWGKTARRIEKGVQEVVKGVPAHESDYR